MHVQQYATSNGCQLEYWTFLESLEYMSCQPLLV